MVCQYARATQPLTHYSLSCVRAPSAVLHSTGMDASAYVIENDTILFSTQARGALKTAFTSPVPR